MGSESRYRMFDLSSWQGSSVATLMFMIAILVGGLLMACRKYRKLKKRLPVTKTDVESGPRRDFIQMTDLAPISAFLKCPQISNCVNDGCSLNKAVGRDPAKCNNAFHLALDREKRSVSIAKESVECK